MYQFKLKSIFTLFLTLDMKGQCQKFVQHLVLTDGSRIAVTSVSPLRPVVKLAIDSLTHPSWNPDSLNKRKLQASDQLDKFRSRYAQIYKSNQ